MSINLLPLVIFTMASCAESTRPPAVAVAPNQIKPGVVESVQVVVHHVQGEPVIGALAGGLIGGLLFRGPATVFGAAAGAGIGAAASSGNAETHVYQVFVHFDDGEHAMFVYRDFTPFEPGEHVKLTSHGLHAG
jgi:outer membrane lipoprotein SlyB